MHLTAFEEDMAAGGQGAAVAFAMDILLRFGEAIGAPALLEIAQAHVDGCLYHGEVSLDFVERLVAEGGRVRAPTTLNVGSMDLLHPELIGGAAALRSAGRRLMEAHLALGCEPSFTCAPYQTRFRPRFGEQIAWGESNAIVFANSVIGARTNRYGDFIDLCCAMTGRAPAFGLHLDANRKGEILFRVHDAAEATDTLYVAVGAVIGARSEGRIPVIEDCRRRDRKTSSRRLARRRPRQAPSRFSMRSGSRRRRLPTATRLAAASRGKSSNSSSADLRDALAKLSTAPEGAPLVAVSLGTPHFSLGEFQTLAPLLSGFRAAPGVEVYVNTGRETYAAIAGNGLLAGLEAAGVIVVTDTCTYVTSILRKLDGVVMTNSGKWAHYAPGNLGVEVAFGSLEDCIASAAAGRVVRSALL